MSKTVAFVMNPNAANGRCGKLWPKIHKLAKKLYEEVRVYHTTGVGDGIAKTARACSEGADLVISVGGDGTHNEAVNGLMSIEGKRPEWAILSLGTGGDLRKTVGWPLDPEAALEGISQGNSRAVDVGRLEYVDFQGKPGTRYFGNITSVGVGGLVDQMVNRTTKILGGKASFFMGTVRGSLAYSNQPVRILADGNLVYEGKIYSAAVCNGRFFGGGMMIAPQASLSDGLFDLVIMEDLSFLRTLAMAPRIYKGTHIGQNGVSYHRCREVEVQTDSDQVFIDLDGEVLGRMPGRFVLEPEAIKMRVPAS